MKIFGIQILDNTFYVKKLFIINVLISQLILSQEFIMQKLAEPNTSIRAIQIDGNKIWYVGSHSDIGQLDLDTKEHLIWKVPQEKQQFRSLAQTNNCLFFANVSSPGYFYKMFKDSKEISIAFTDQSPKAFYDVIFFKNNKKGIAFGDPYYQCPTIQITKNLGQTWKKISCAKLPKLEIGEAAFASSNSNIFWRGSKIGIVTGGKKSRILFSSNNADSWEVFETPFVQGEEESGMYSIDVLASGFGIAVGGNYTKQKDNKNNIAITRNFGKTWEIVANEKNSGYKTCVAIKPYSNGKIIIALGDQSIEFSEDYGYTWRVISEEKNLYIAKWYDQHTIILAGNKKIMQLKWRNKK